MKEGHFMQVTRRTKPAFKCPPTFMAEYNAFCEELIYLGFSKTTIDSSTQKTQKLISHLVTNGVQKSADITINHIDDFMRLFERKSPNHVGVFLYTLRKYFTFLFEQGYISHDLASKLPKVREVKNATIPYTWKKADLQKLLDSVDRADPKGKRDYAILLLAIRLGLRYSDIRNLKPTSINWNRNTLNLLMVKTGQPIELPLLKDVGWAIIDYLQNGRPVTDSDYIFIRHKAPFNALGSRGAFDKGLRRYILKSGINIPAKQRGGLHSLRSTLAGNMLDIKVPLPIISETLGHQSIHTTGHYLMIDIEGLRKCAVDPEGVISIESSI